MGPQKVTPADSGCAVARTKGIRRIIVQILIAVALTVPASGFADSLAPPEPPSEIDAGLNYLIDYCQPDQGRSSVDFARIQPVVEFIRQAPEMADYLPPERDNTKGAFIAFSVQRSLPEIIRYAYNRHIPEGAINASSVNFSYWKEAAQDGTHTVLDLWQRLDDLSTPYIASGVVRESIAPDLHTGTYYEYDLQRTFVLFRQGQSRVMISLSRQMGSSDVGKKGYIVGHDQDWNYLYTQDTGLNKPGLGWVKPKISRYYSVCCFIEDQAGSGNVKIGVFQWLGAGWIGMNVVDSHHIRRGLVRFADQFKSVIECAQMPDAAALEQVCRRLEKTDDAILREKAKDVTRHIREKAEQDDALRDKPAIQKLDAAAYVAGMRKDQLVTLLMREYLKFCLGKETPLSPTFWVALKKTPVRERQPLS